MSTKKAAKKATKKVVKKVVKKADAPVIKKPIKPLTEKKRRIIDDVLELMATRTMTDQMMVDEIQKRHPGCVCNKAHISWYRRFINAGKYASKAPVPELPYVSMVEHEGAIISRAELTVLLKNAKKKSVKKDELKTKLTKKSMKNAPAKKKGTKKAAKK